MDYPHHFRFENYRPEPNCEILPLLVDCYRDVFGSDPWNEWKICSVCNKVWGIEEFQHGTDKCKCGGRIVDFWPREKVKEDILTEVQKDSVCWLATDKDRSCVVGFCWGYPINTEELSQKLELSITDITQEKFGVCFVGYHDEIGVAKKFQGCKIGKALLHYYISDIKDKGVRVGVVRTKAIPPTIAYEWYRRIGFEDIACYDDGRVIMARSL